MKEHEKDSINILAEMRRKLEERKNSNRSATFFISFLYLVSFIILIYLGAVQILTYISVFVIMIFILVYSNFRQSKKDIQAIDELYLEYEYIKNKK